MRLGKSKVERVVRTNGKVAFVDTKKSLLSKSLHEVIDNIDIESAR